MVRFDCLGIVASCVMAARRWSEAEPEGGPAIEIEHPVRRADGGARMVRTWIRRAVEDGAPVVSGVSQDITDRHAAELALRAAVQASEAANEATSRFLDTIGHELRTPLNVINGFSELIASEISGPVALFVAEDTGDARARDRGQASELQV